MYDVAVIGAGPIGCYTAYQLADKGFDVLLLEEDDEIGRNVVCTGVIGKEAFERFDIPKDSIIAKINRLLFVSPSNIHLEYIHQDELAYVVNRYRFDNGIFQLALSRGVEVKLGEGVQDIREEEDRVVLQTNSSTYRANTAVIATGVNPAPCPASRSKAGEGRGVMRCGVNYELQRSAGMGIVKNFLMGAQINLPEYRTYEELSTANSTVEIHTGRRIAPGSFGWVVPSNGSVRVGVMTEKNPKYWLKKFIENRLNQVISNDDKFREKPIAFGSIERSVSGRILAVGEAAGQVKTTTGGGIFYGLLGSEIAVNMLTKAIKTGNMDYLTEYEQRWRGMLEEEIFMGWHIRKLAKRIDDETLDRLFKRFKRGKFLAMRIIRRINFEYHGALLAFCLKAFGGIIKG